MAAGRGALAPRPLRPRPELGRRLPADGRRTWPCGGSRSAFARPADYRAGGIDPESSKKLARAIGRGHGARHRLTTPTAASRPSSACWGPPASSRMSPGRSVEDAGEGQWDWSRWDRQVEILRRAGPEMGPAAGLRAGLRHAQVVSRVGALGALRLPGARPGLEDPVAVEPRPCGPGSSASSRPSPTATATGRDGAGAAGGDGHLRRDALSLGTGRRADLRHPRPVPQPWRLVGRRPLRRGRASAAHAPRALCRRGRAEPGLGHALRLVRRRPCPCCRPRPRRRGPGSISSTGTSIR